MAVRGWLVGGESRNLLVFGSEEAGVWRKDLVDGTYGIATAYEDTLIRTHRLIALFVNYKWSP